MVLKRLVVWWLWIIIPNAFAEASKVSALPELEVSGHVTLPGDSVAEASSYLYRIHPSYCSCKRVCMSGCTQLCDSCTMAIQNICTLMLDMNGSAWSACNNNAPLDLHDQLKISTTNTQSVPLSFEQKLGFDASHIYRVGQYLGFEGDYFKCKKICNNIDGTGASDTCNACKQEICQSSGACSLAGPKNYLKCLLTCNADLQFYDSQQKCIQKDISCKSIHVDLA